MERRIYYIDWMRAFGALAVVLLHVFQTVLGNYPPSVVGMPVALAWCEVQIIATRWAVPVFFMISGRLLLDPDRSMPPRKLVTYITRMLVVLATFGFAFCVMELLVDERALSWGLIGRALVNLLTRRSWAHMWYVYTLIVFYLLTPLLRWVVRTAGRRLGAVVVGVGVVTLVVPTALALTGTDTSALLGLSGAFYFLLGYWTRTIEGPRPLLTVAAVTSIAIVGMTVGRAIVAGDGYAEFMREPESPLIAIYSLWVFLLFKHYLDREPSGGVIGLLSDYSFGIYIIHPLFLNLLYKGLHWGVTIGHLPPFAFEVTTFAIALAGSLVATWLFKRLPLFRRII